MRLKFIAAALGGFILGALVASPMIVGATDIGIERTCGGFWYGVAWDHEPGSESSYPWYNLYTHVGQGNNNVDSREDSVHCYYGSQSDLPPSHSARVYSSNQSFGNTVRKISTNVVIGNGIQAFNDDCSNPFRPSTSFGPKELDTSVVATGLQDTRAPLAGQRHDFARGSTQDYYTDVLYEAEYFVATTLREREVLDTPALIEEAIAAAMSLRDYFLSDYANTRIRERLTDMAAVWRRVLLDDPEAQYQRARTLPENFEFEYSGE